MAHRMRGKLTLVFTAALALMVSGCAIRFGNQSQAPVVLGVFKSGDRTENWVAKNLFLHSGGAGTIAGVSVMSVIFDPQDTNALYLTSSDGLLYSYDAGESWQRANSLTGPVRTVAIDPGNKCVIYAGLNHTVVKSVDCSRSWAEVYLDEKPEKVITALGVDFFNNLIIYAGNSAGDVLKSDDGGVTWRVSNRFKNAISRFLIDPSDSRVIYVATAQQGLFKTTDGGVTWTDLNNGLQQYSGAFEFRHLIFDPTQANSLLLVAKYGLLKSEDAGETWQPVTLIPPPASTDILAVAISPADNQEIYYATASTFYQTFDGGQNWITKRLPTRGVPSVMLIDPTNPNVVYLGVAAPPSR